MERKKYFLIILILILIFVWNDRNCSSCTNRTKDANLLYDTLKEKFNEIHPQGIVSNTSKLGWHWGYYAKAAINAYKYTCQVRFLDTLIESYEIILQYRDSELNRIDEVRDEILKAWSYKKNPKSKRQVKLTHTGMISLPIALLCEAVLKNRNSEKKYKDIAVKFLKSVEDAVSVHDDYYRLTPKNEGYYIYPENVKRAEPLNHTHTIAATYAVLYSITGNKDYRIRVEQISRYFKSTITKLKNGSYVWGYDPQPYPEYDRKNYRAENIRKAGITILLPIIAYERDIFFINDDMIAFSKTFLHNIYLGNNQFKKNISWSEFSKPNNRKRYLPSITKFIYFDNWDPKIRKIIEEAVEARKDIFPRGWFSFRSCLPDYAYSLQ
jgi:hypothetical protein